MQLLDSVTGKTQVSIRILPSESGLLVAQTELAFEHIVTPRKAKGLLSG